MDDFDIMRSLRFPKSNQKLGINLCILWILLYILSMVCQFVTVREFVLPVFFNTLFYIFFIVLCMRGFLSNSNSMIEISTSVLFIWFGINGFFAVSSTFNVDIHWTFTLYSIFGFITNSILSIAFFLFVFAWIYRYNERLKNLYKCFLLATFPLSIITSVFYFLYMYLYIGDSSTYWLIATQFPTICSAIVIPYCFYYIDR